MLPIACAIGFSLEATRIHLTDCPAIIWMEDAHAIDKVRVAVVLKRAQVHVDEPFIARFEPTQNGAVLLISRFNRLGHSQ